MNDADILENRVQAMRELPWVIPALTVIQFSDEDLDRLDSASESQEYWSVLNDIVVRIQRQLEKG